MKTSARIVNRLFLYFGILCVLYYLGMGVTVSFRQSLMILWLLLGVLCIGRHFLWKIAWKKGMDVPFPKRFLFTVRLVLGLCFAVFFSFECWLCGTAWQKPKSGMDAILVLGAKVNDDGPSGSLRERIDTAADYLSANPECIAVLSGGQGEDEPMSEAQCMWNRLTAAGIDPDRLILEEKATSTKENFLFGLALLPEDTQTVGIVTNDFHILRASAMADKIGGYTYGAVPARSTVTGFIHYAMREFFAVAAGWAAGELNLFTR